MVLISQNTNLKFMKLLMTFAKKFAYVPNVKNLESAEVVEEGKEYNDVLVAFIQVEEKDEEQELKKVEKKLVNNLKWGARKNECKHIILHSFAHLSTSKASPEFTKEIFDKAEARLKNADYEANQSPFGYFLDLDIQLPGYSQARIFRDF